MKRLTLWTIILGIGAGLGAGGYYVATHWKEINPLGSQQKIDALQNLTAQMRRTCMTEKDLHGASIRLAEVLKGKLAIRGWIARPDQKAKLEDLAQSLLDEEPELKEKCDQGILLSFTVFPIPQLLMQLQHDFDEGKGAEADEQNLRRAVMRTTRLDGAAFTENARLHVHAVSIRGSAKQDTTAAALQVAIKSRLEASGFAPETVPDLILDVRYFTSPALLLQREIARREVAKDVYLTAAWYDGRGKLRIDGIWTRKEHKQLIDTALDRITADPNYIAMFRAPEAGTEKLDIDVRPTLFDDSAITAQLQKQLVETARKHNKARLRRIRFLSVAPAADMNEKNEPVVDDEGNPSYVFRVAARSLPDNAQQRDEILNELGRWLRPRLPLVTNPDQRPMSFQIDMRSKSNLAFALQERLIERELDGAVVTDALYDEDGTLELSGRLHEVGAASKQAIDAAFKDLLADEMPWTGAPLKAHETRKDGQPLAWQEVVRGTKLKLAADDTGKRLRLDRLYYRYEKDQLRLVADGAFLTGFGKDEPAKTLARAVDEIIATRGNAELSLSALKILKNPIHELQNLAAERAELDGVLVTQARYDTEGLLHVDGFLGQRGQKSLLAGLALERLGKIPDIVKKGSDPKTSSGWSIDAMKMHASLKGESSWNDVVRGCQIDLASEPALRRATVERMHFQYDDPQSAQATLLWKGTYLTKAEEKVDEPALTRKIADTCKMMLPDLPSPLSTLPQGEGKGVRVQPALTKVGTPIYALQDLAVKQKLDGMLFADAYFDREGKLVLEGKRGNDEQVKDVKALIDRVLAESKTPIAPGGLAPFERMIVVPWQPLLVDIQTQFAQGTQAFQRQTRIDRVYFQHDDASKKAIIHIEGVSLYQGKTPTLEEQTASVLGVLRKQLDAKGVEKFAVSLRGVERKPNPAVEMQDRAVKAGIDGAVFNIGFDEKGVCVIRMPFIPAGHEESIRKLLEEYSKKHPHLGTLQLR